MRGLPPCDGRSTWGLLEPVGNVMPSDRDRTAALPVAALGGHHFMNSFELSAGRGVQRMFAVLRQTLLLPRWLLSVQDQRVLQCCSCALYWWWCGCCSHLQPLMHSVLCVLRMLAVTWQLSLCVVHPA